MITGRNVSRYNPGLDPGIALPLPALALVIILHGIKTHYQGAAFPVWAQVRINTEDKAMGCFRAKCLDQTAGKTGEKFIIGHGTGPALCLS